MGTRSKQGGVVLFPVEGGAPLITQIAGQTRLAWSGDRKHVFVVPSVSQASGNAYVFPVAQGKLVPDNIVQGLPSEQELLKLPGVRVISSGAVAPGLTAATYAFTRESLQRNLYRIPVP